MLMYISIYTKRIENSRKCLTLQIQLSIGARQNTLYSYVYAFYIYTTIYAIVIIDIITQVVHIRLCW